MTTVKRFRNCKIAIFNDHGAPHFHIIGANADVVVDLATMAVRHGDARKYREVLDWAEANRDQLLSLWTTLNPKG